MACTVAARAPVAARAAVAWTGRPYSSPCSHSREQRTGRMCSTFCKCHRSVRHTAHRRMAVVAAAEVARAARAVKAAIMDWVAEKVAKAVTAVVEARAADRVKVAEAAARAARKAARTAAIRPVQT